MDTPAALEKHHAAAASRRPPAQAATIHGTAKTLPPGG
jgi:hypothetical protein